ncbi:uncharacterized protein [Battus philenor]|uniref:uncharacterized protein n=1 Tax=Battus philenor TaxID=42288 RepID=UPI0035CF1668
MAGNRLSSKAKGKEEKSKVNKGGNQTNEESEDLDYTLLRKPILTSVTGFAQARKIFDSATEELKSLLSTECDLLYECKVCRNLFRSLANFISHKRMYCKEKFNSTIHSHFINPTCTSSEIIKIKHLEEEYQESLKPKNNHECVESNETEERIPLTKDLTAIVEKISISKGVKETVKEEQEIFLQKIPKTSVAVFQNVNFNGETQCDIRSQVRELDTILSQNKAVLQSDGKFMIQNSEDPDKPYEPENVIQISDDDENEDSNILKCKICDLQFSTQKTLRFHMKYKHLESRLVYPCPDCLEIFSTSWSVYRHLFKVHRKTAAQIRRLRESIQSKAFRMNNPPAYYEKRKNNIKTSTPQKITEEERLDQENQAWMDNMEGDGEIPRCGGCGRTFERRAALAAHTHTCQPRSRALARRADTKKIEIQIRKDYNKGPAGLSLPIKTTDANDNKLYKEENQLPSKVENQISPDDAQKEEVMPGTLVDSNKEESMETANSSIDRDNFEKKVINNSEQFIPKLPFAQQTEKNNLAALKSRLQPDTDLEKLLCKKCDVKYNQLQELYDHMAGHYKWLRYACKLCNFKHYNFEKLPEHVKIVHKLKGDSDFYFSTVKAIDANEALELCEPIEQTSDINGTSPDSRRPSRCSSDSSRLSDDSSSSSTRIEGAKKRKMNSSRNIAKKKKDITLNDEIVIKKCNDILFEKDSVTEIEQSVNIKNFEENSSDIDDIEEKISKKHIIGETSTVRSRRPIRKRTRPKNEDFEYDLSNLLKMEAQGYRDSQLVTNTKSYQSKKKIQMDLQNTFEIANKDCCGALVTLSKKAVQNSAALMKIPSFTINNAQKEQRSLNVFVRPMLPKVSKGDKTSPKKDNNDESHQSESKKSLAKENKLNKTSLEDTATPSSNDSNTISIINKTPIDNEKSKIILNNDNNKQKPANTACETVKTNVNIPTIVPIKFRQSLDVINNPVLNKNISDLSKSGMKTKILVIKPINRNKDGTQSIKAPLKFQTIKLKDPSKGSSSKEEKSSDQVLVVQVPKVDCAVTRPSIKLSNIDNLETTENVDKENPVEKDKITSEEKEKPVVFENDDSTVLTESTTNKLVPQTSESIINNKAAVDEDTPVNSIFQ